MKISVALCTYNGERFIEEQLNSILSQTVLPDEIIICDDDSSDHTLGIINSVSKENNTIKIYVNKPALKTIKNFEKAMELCEGEWIFLSDQDDVWENNKIEKMISYATVTNAWLLFSNAKLIDDKGMEIHSSLWEKWGFSLENRMKWKKNIKAFNDLLEYKNYVTGATVLINKRLKRDAIPISVPYGYYHDAWLALHASANQKLFFIEDKLIKYRIHKHQQVGITKGGKDMSSTNTYNTLEYEDFLKKIRAKYFFLYWRYRINRYLSKIKTHIKQ